MAKYEQKPIGYFEIASALGLVIAILTFMWMLHRQPVGWLYHMARRAETFGLWSYSAWGQYFAANVRGSYDWKAIYLSSLPFGVVCAVAILLIGLLVRGNISQNNILSFIRRKKGGDIDQSPLSPFELMDRMAPIYPHCEFFRRFPMDRYSMTKGPAGMPLSSLEFLDEAGAIELGGARSIGKLEDNLVVVDKAKVRHALIARFGPENPFLAVERLRDDAAVRAAVESLHWSAAVILYGALARVNALRAGAGELAKSTGEIDEFMKSVWRDINAEKRALGDRLVIAPYDYPPASAEEDVGELGLPSEFDGKGASKPKARKKSKAAKADPAPEELIILSEHLESVAPSKFKSVKTAREGLTRIIANPAKPKSYDDEGGGVTASIDEIVTAHGYVFGLLASSLTDGEEGTFAAARAVGVFPPSGFLWLRFVDRSLWRFLNYVGMQTPCPEAAGMFDHWQMELQLRAPRRRPEVSDQTIQAILTDARRFTPKSLEDRDIPERAAEILEDERAGGRWIERGRLVDNEFS